MRHEAFTLIHRLNRSPRLRAWAWFLTLVGLAAITSIALAVYASRWLVPPYLLMMALILGIPSTSRKGKPGKLHHEAKSKLEDDLERDSKFEASATVDAPRFEVVSRPDPDFDSESNGDSESDSDLSPAKSRRGRGKSRKPRTLGPVDSTPTWVRVGPGKFVRADLLPSGLPDVMETPAPNVVAEESGPDLSIQKFESEGDNGIAPDAPEPSDLKLETESEGDNGIAPDAPEPSDLKLEIESEGDNGIAPDALELSDSMDVTVEVTDLLDEPEAGESGPTASVELEPSPMRWLQFGRQRATVEARSGRSNRVNPGVRALPRRFDRGSRRSVGADRSHPPRSPPRQSSL